ncbi:MAG: sigma-70 family RNA polymerase sigma factor, partial [Deltaproteobacteria bacterium]|nr:sigma-70 family RNA polymerase sigma factor [Deltaproteobacteria bacterium]
VLVLYYREQRSARDIAALLDISEAAVLQRLARGRDALAAGVNALVEGALRGQRVRKNFVGGVLAALPPFVPSRVDASPSSPGGIMSKLSIAAVVFAGLGTTAIVVHQRSSAASPTAPVAAVATPASQSPPIGRFPRSPPPPRRVRRR